MNDREQMGGAGGGNEMQQKKGIKGDRPAGETQKKYKRGEKITKYEIERGDRRDPSLR